MRQIDDKTVEWFKSALVKEDYSRFQLARELCERTDWRNARGDLCVSQAGKMLPKLADELGLKLPAARGAKPAVGCLPDYGNDLQLRCRLADLGAVSLELVKESDGAQWRSMMQTHHPRGAPSVPGRHLRYWVISEICGRVGGLSFHEGSWHVRARDEYIGWGARARAANLPRVLSNSRFLILPGVRVHGLASSALRLAGEQAADDWEAEHRVRPLLMYTYIDEEHSGESYLAAGWVPMKGKTTGRRARDGRPKQVFARTLSESWQEELCAFVPPRFASSPNIYVAEGAHWTDIEYGCSTHPDGRVAARIRSMGRDWQCEPGESVPQVFASEAKKKAAYRLLSNEKVSMDDILESHRAATVERAAAHDVVLMVQDTTMLNYDTLKGSTKGLTSIGGRAQGICAHVLLAQSESGRPLGAVDIDGTFRAECSQDADLVESRRWIEGVETAAEFSRACGGETRVVCVGDRESDIWELYEKQHELAEHAGVLVRCADRGGGRRMIDDDGNEMSLRGYAESLPVVKKRTVEIAGQGGKRARKGRRAKLSMRIAKVQVEAPRRRDRQVSAEQTLEMIAVSVKEDSPRKGTEPLNWLLLCSEGEADGENAERICRWYEQRWMIEEYFRVLKSGMKTEDRRFDSADDLLKSLAFDAVTAWRVFDLQKIAGTDPDRPAAEVVSWEEIEIVRMLLKEIDRKIDIRPPPDLTVAHYATELGRLVGFRPTKKQPIPGVQILWKANKKLMISIQAIRTYKKNLELN